MLTFLLLRYLSSEVSSNFIRLEGNVTGKTCGGEKTGQPTTGNESGSKGEYDNHRLHQRRSIVLFSKFDFSPKKVIESGKTVTTFISIFSSSIKGI